MEKVSASLIRDCGTSTKSMGAILFLQAFPADQSVIVSMAP